MSSKAEQIAATAESDINKSRDDVDCSGTHDWCAQYVSRVLNRCEIPEYDTIVTYLLNKLLASGKWVEKTGSDPMRGDIMAFDRNHIQEERPLDHILIVTGFDGTTITYVDGNGGGSQYVKQRTIAYSDPAVERWIRYSDEGGSFYPTTPCYDISFAQAPGGDILTCIDAIANADGGGILLQVGGLRNNGFNPETDFNVAEAVARIKSHNMGLGVYFYNYGNYENDLTSVFQAALDYLQTIGCTKDDINMGVWIDTEHGQSWDPDPSSDKSVNYAYVERFMNLFDNAGYAVAGVYSSAANFEPWYGSERIGNRPIWAAYWTGTFDTVDRSTLDYFLPESSYTEVYIMQYSQTGRVSGYSGNLDCDKVLAPMPTNGGGGGGTVSAVTVSVIAPKRIYFSPNPDVFLGESEFLNTSQEITITTDAENAEIYYTVDGSSPYQYQRVVGNENWQYVLSSHAVKYTEPVTIKTDTHFRVIAVPTGTESAIDPLLAKGSGTFLFNFTPTSYSWEQEQYAYRLMSEDKKVKYFEENRQAFLRYHAEETAEEILYNTVIAASEQSSGTIQPESGDAGEGGHADDDI